jgi:hypothetical protein
MPFLVVEANVLAHKVPEGLVAKLLCQGFTTPAQHVRLNKMNNQNQTFVKKLEKENFFIKKMSEMVVHMLIQLMVYF